MEGQDNSSPAAGQASVQLPPNPQSAQPSQEQQKQSSRTENISKDLIADLTVGLPKPFRLLQETLLLFRHKFVNFMLVIIIPVLLTYSLTKLQTVIEPYLPHQILFFLVQCFTFLLSFFLIMFGYIALLFSIKDNEENISVIKAYKRAGNHVHHFFRLILLNALIVFAGFTALIVPGVIIDIWFSMAVFIYIIEDLRGMNALLQSKGYVEKYWIPVLGRWLFIGLFLLLLCIPFFIVELFSVQLLSELVFIATVSIIIPIASIFGFLVYGNLRLLRGDTTAYVNVLQSTNSTKQKLDVLRSTFYKGALLGLPLVLYLLYTYVTRPFLVQGNSMEPAFIHNEIVVTSIAAGNSPSFQRGDVIIFESPVDPEKKLIKRIIGTPGETVSIQQGELYVNNTKLDEKGYLPAETATEERTFLKEGYVFIIPRNHYFVLGDNREDSEDSREWGAIRSRDIIGKIHFCLWGCPKENSNK